MMLVFLFRMRQSSKAYSGVSIASGDEPESSDYQGRSGKIPRPKRTPNDSLEMVENGSRAGVSDYDDLRVRGKLGLLFASSWQGKLYLLFLSSNFFGLHI